MSVLSSQPGNSFVRVLSCIRTAGALVFVAALVLFPSGCDVLGLGGSDGTSDESQDSNRFVEIFQEHPSSSALYVTHADTLVAAYNSDQKLPLASTVKYVVAIEYARQAAEGTIDPDSLVSLEQVNRFFIDYGTQASTVHRNWIDRARQRGLVSDGRVPVRAVARGMMDFSSNPAAEYLLELLTLEEINRTLDEVGVERHDRVYYFLSALYIGTERGLEGEERAQFIRNLTPEQRASRASEIHRKLKQDADSSYRAQLELPGRAAQHAWSDHLPASTAREYAELMRDVNDRALLDEGARIFFYEVVNGIVRESPENRERFAYAGSKGGSTAWVFTEAAFFTEHDGGAQTEYAVLFDGPPQAQNRLVSNFNDFRQGVLGDPSFRKTLAQELGREQAHAIHQ